ncbi:MAG: ABC transporter ATP-binding protein/permease [Oscillospiraceae bacterium]|nr:ABC transporter ATP-binding protein/permease [Oscillospiraceae bacterium]
MTDSQDARLSLRETLSLMGYGYKLVSKLTPAFLPLMLLQALLTAAQPMLVLFFSARVLDQLSGAKDVHSIVLYVCITVAATFVMSAARAFLTRELETDSNYERIYQKMLMMQAEQFIKMDYAHAEDSKISEALARMDTHARGNGLGFLNVYFVSTRAAEQFFSMIFSLLLIFGPLAVGVGISGWPAWALFGFFIFGLLLVFRMHMNAQSILKKVYAENAKANTAAGYYGDYIKAGEAAKDIRLYDQSAALVSIFRNSFNVKAWMPFFFYFARTQGLMLGILAILSGGFYMLAGYGALGGTATVGGIVQSVGAVTAFAGAVGSIVSTFGQLINNVAFLKPMREFLNLPALLVKGTRPTAKAQGHDHELEFRNVSFRYPGVEEYALKNLNLKLNAGQRLAVVGLNGSGKTTMIKLLCRLYDPTEGVVLLDGVDIREYDYEQYIALFSVVFQDFQILPFRLGANVAVGEQFDEALVTERLDGAGFSERLSTMPDGLDTMLYKTYDEDGTQVSGGEAQKIALARALYRDAPIVVLDEPTAALDPIAEYEVYSTFEQTIGGKTAVFISHRLSSCRFCHDIAVFEGGQMVQRGEHDALLAEESGLYRKLWDAQAQHYVE